MVTVPPKSTDIGRLHSSGSGGSNSSITSRAVSRQDLAEVQQNHYDDDDDVYVDFNDDVVDCDDDTNDDFFFPNGNTNSYGCSAGGNRVSITMNYWMRCITKHWKRLMSLLYTWCVAAMANFISSVMSQKVFQDLICEIIVRAINAFMDQEDIGTKMDDTARRVLYDRSKAKDAAHSIGKEVVPMVTGFVGGVASSLTPSTLKKKRNKRRQKNDNQKQCQSSNNDNNSNNNNKNNSVMTSISTMSDDGFPLESLEEHDADEVEQHTEDDSHDPNNNSNTVDGGSSTKSSFLSFTKKFQ